MDEFVSLSDNPTSLPDNLNDLSDNLDSKPDKLYDFEIADLTESANKDNYNCTFRLKCN
ncbi:MAG: hypothetical protein IPL55_21520 [Saprospiraceae bacterium]|jgi:hypothetical protein|nr:hypothetical protein [Saprospiraceae bacterium]